MLLFCFKKPEAISKESLIEQSDISGYVKLHKFHIDCVMNLTSTNVYSPKTVRLKCFSFDDALFEPLQI